MMANNLFLLYFRIGNFSMAYSMISIFVCLLFVGALVSRTIRNPRYTSCLRKGHCAGDPCTTYNDCDGSLICKTGKCSDGTGSGTGTESAAKMNNFSQQGNTFRKLPNGKNRKKLRITINFLKFTRKSKKLPNTRLRTRVDSATLGSGKGSGG